MKKAFLLSLFTLIWAFQVWGDRESIISVKSFEMIQTDMEAMTNRVTDDSGDLTALIKIETSERGFEFSCGSLGIVKVDESHTGEVWVYVQQYAAKITIKHSKLGILRDYKFPTGDLIEGRTYVMKIVSDKNDETLVNGQFLEVQVYPREAMVEIDGSYVEVSDKGIVTEWVTMGDHSYRVTAKGFRPMPGVVSVTDPHNKTKISVRLQPAVGYLKVSNVMEYNGASVYVDNTKVCTLPMDSILLESGTHQVRVSKQMYKPHLETIEIEDGKTFTVTPTLEQNYATVTINTGLDAEIWVNGVYLGKSSWQGNLESGYAVIEARKKGHKTTTRKLEIGVGAIPGIALSAPTPAYGTLNVTSVPKGAIVKVDDQEVGKTPLSQKILIGEHSFRIEKNGCQTETETIEIKEDSITTVDKEMAKAYSVDMSCDIPDAKWWADSIPIGEGKKVKTWLKPGRHIIKVSAYGYDDYMAAIDVEKGSNSHDFYMSKITPDTVIFTVNKVSFKMIKVKGNYFEMGNASGNRMETPQHTVTLNSYYISETMVTQELWFAATGITLESQMQLLTDVSEESQMVGKGNHSPMYFVNIEDCQKFIDLINQTTGKYFQLPTEAQWEYAAKGGKNGNAVEPEMWCKGNSGGKVHDVKLTTANGLGLYDMQGNLWEWCRDKSGDYSSESQTNPTGSGIGKENIIRGGCWADYKVACRPTMRLAASEETRNNRIGFRLVIEIGKGKK